MANRVIFGINGAFLGLKVSKPGFNVLTATADQLLFNSDVKNFQVYAQGVAVLTGNVGTFVNVTVPASSYPLLVGNPGWFPGGGAGYGAEAIYTSTTNVRIQKVYEGGTNTTVRNYRYALILVGW